jgi:hypothetical protein
VKELSEFDREVLIQIANVLSLLRSQGGGKPRVHYDQFTLSSLNGIVISLVGVAALADEKDLCAS